MASMYIELEPIKDTHPAGADVRYEPEFEELQAEIDKLSLPSATTTVNWLHVKQLSSTILTTKSKDLLVASYFAIAGIRVDKLEVLEAGLTVFGGIIETYWDSLFPSKKRMRGRIAAITWLLEKCESAIENIEIDPVSEEFVTALQEQVQKIDALLQEYIEDAPLLRPLQRIIENLPVEEDVPPHPPTPVPQLDTVAEAEDTEKPPPAEISKKEIPVRQKPEIDPAAPPASASSTFNVSVTEIEKAVRTAFQTVKHAADFYFNEDLTSPKSYRCRRVAGWTLIHTLPPASEGKTLVPLPGEFETVKKKLQDLQKVENWQELLKESEQRLNGSLLWLDLNRLSAESLESMGPQYTEAHEAICQETAYFINRLPGLDKHCFADGTPFADAETRQWLEMISQSSEPSLSAPVSQTKESPDHLATVVEQALNLASGNQLVQAINILKDEMQKSHKKKKKLLWQLNLAQLLVNFREPKLALPHMREIMQNIETYRLEQWDPSFATHALQIVWSGFKKAKAPKEQTDEVLDRIAKLDPVAAMQLNK